MARFLPTELIDEFLRNIRTRRDVQVKSFLILYFSICYAVFVVAVLNDLHYANRHPIWVAENPKLLSELDHPLFFPFIWICPGPLNDDRNTLSDVQCAYTVVDGSGQSGQILNTELQSLEITNAQGVNVTHDCVVVDVVPGDVVTAANPMDFIECSLVSDGHAEVFVQFANEYLSDWFNWQVIPDGTDFAFGLTSVTYFGKGMQGPFYRAVSLDTGDLPIRGSTISFTARFDSIGSESFVEIRNGSFLQTCATCGGMWAVFYGAYVLIYWVTSQCTDLGTVDHVETYDSL